MFVLEEPIAELSAAVYPTIPLAGAQACPFRAYSLVTGADLAISNGHRLNAPTSPQVGPHP